MKLPGLDWLRRRGAPFDTSFLTSFDTVAWRWAALRWQQRLGRPGAAALLLLLALVLVQWLVVHPRAQRAEARLEEVRRALAQPMPAARGIAVPGQPSADEQLQTVFNLLREHHLATPQAQYKQSWGAPSSRHPGRLTVDLPLKGKYQDLRAAMEDLSGLRDVHVDRASLRRQALASESLAIDLRIVLGVVLSAAPGTEDAR